MCVVPPNSASSDPRMGAISLRVPPLPTPLTAAASSLPGIPACASQPFPAGSSDRPTASRCPNGNPEFPVFLFFFPFLRPPSPNRILWPGGQPPGMLLQSREPQGATPPKSQGPGQDGGTFCQAVEDSVGTAPIARAFAPNWEKMEDKAEGRGRAPSWMAIRPSSELDGRLSILQNPRPPRQIRLPTQLSHPSLNFSFPGG